ncbi:trypsin-like peptidase domain-containing protein [Candidatus Parcubacteria bacterium]|nr:trypsin-like peptidase domain-containing protein [Candidatus Parcubacteria bacterium]
MHDSGTSLYKLLTTILILGLGIFGLYEYQISKSLEAQVQGIKSQVATLAESSSVREASLTDAVAKVAPAVVSIVISKDVSKVEVEYENTYGFYLPIFRDAGRAREAIGAGSGFIVRADGYIVTNKHVVEDAEAEYTVFLTNGSKKTARIVYIDPHTDIAIIKIDGSNYPTAALGDSSTLSLGQTVAAIGNALGEYSNTVSTGIVSGLERDVEAEDVYGNREDLKDVIQTDAAVNLGNSGGPLLNLEGEVVGVNVATVIGSNNIAFSIPINAVRAIIDKIL